MHYKWSEKMADEQTITASEQKKEDWMNSKWRPMMGWMYMLVCTMDFVTFPILWSLLQSLSHGQVTSQWQPLTLQGAGLFHIAMGGVLGLAAYGRTQEKLNGANNGGLTLPSNAGTTYIPPTGNTSVTVSNQPSASGGFGGASNGFGNNVPTGGSTAFSSSPAGGFGSSGFGSNSGSGASTGGFSGSGFGGTSTTSPAAAPVTGQVAAGFGGKLGPVPAQDPVI